MKKKLFFLLPFLTIAGCTTASLQIKPTQNITLGTSEYVTEPSLIRVIDNRDNSERQSGYVSDYFKGYRLGDEQLNFDRRQLLENYLNAHLKTETPQAITLSTFTLHHVEPETVLVSSRKLGDPDYALGVESVVGGALGAVLGEAIRAGESTSYKNGDPYFLCTIKLITQGQKTSIRHYKAQNYYAELNPENPFASERYTSGLRATLNSCLEKTANKLANSKKFSGFTSRDD
ncbi:hypothetical protein [Amphritea sp.]|uniref:hypothetical protein n=1 Tax=Amphritea sp. TaxID=1872502 RepID=UPI003D0B8D02